MNTWLSILIGALLATTAVAATRPYDEAADAKAVLAQGLAQAHEQKKDVLVVFGANWCPDCRELDKALHGTSADLIDSRFVVVKIDVGNFDKNLDISKRYGYPIAKGIPAAVVLTPEDKVLYATRAGELARARYMGENGIYDFFSKVIAERHP